MRYKNETNIKSNGIVYTPEELAKFLAGEILSHSILNLKTTETISILDPAIGGGELIIALLDKIYTISPNANIIVNGYETDIGKSILTQKKIKQLFPNCNIEIYEKNFLHNADGIIKRYDYIIANPPYIRTQILGAEESQKIAKKIGLNGRVDIYYAFLLYVKSLLSKNGTAGYITSNKFLTIKSGTSVRDFMANNYKIHSIFDFGDTKLFSASVLPCIIVFSLGKTSESKDVSFTSIYEEKASYSYAHCNSIFDHIHDNGTFCTNNNRIFNIQQGVLSNLNKSIPWTISSEKSRQWLKVVDENTCMNFSDIGKIRVGIKTTADNVFIGNDWSGYKADIELLRPLITHRDAGQIVSRNSAGWKVLYTHTVVNGKRSVFDISQYPITKTYLEKHYAQLSGRSYLKKANRLWYEIWVPQNPKSWLNRKIIFRDISEHPEFWIDETGAIVNGDCYWIDIKSTIPEDIVYLALAVANSKFIEQYYDAKFNTKLYSGKRRYMTQYVEQFPIPDNNTAEAQETVKIVKKIITEHEKINIPRYMDKLNILVEKMFYGNLLSIAN